MVVVGDSAPIIEVLLWDGKNGARLPRRCDCGFQRRKADFDDDDDDDGVVVVVVVVVMINKK